MDSITAGTTSIDPKIEAHPGRVGTTIKEWIASLSLEVILYAAFVGLALLLRARDLTLTPLNHDEAERAYQAWRLVEGGIGGIWTAPVPTLLAAGSFFLFGSGDLTARVCSAVIGSVLPALCWLLRPLIGRKPALWAALLLSVSPLAVYYSRVLSGEIVAMTLALLLIAATFRFLQSGQLRFALLAAPLLPALLLSDPLAVGFMLITLLFFALVYAFGSSKLLAETWQTLNASGDTLTRMLALLLASFLLLSTAVLTNLAGFGLPTFGGWLAQFSPGSHAMPWYYHWQLLLSYEPLVLLLGLAGLVSLYRRRPPVNEWWAPAVSTPTAGHHSRWGDLPSPLFIVFIAFWSIAGLLSLPITASKASGQVFIALLPLTLVAAIALDRAIGWAPWPLRRTAWVHLGVLVSVFGFFLVMLSQITFGPAPKTFQVLYLILAAGGTLLVLGSLWQILRHQFAPVVSCTVLVALGFFSLHTVARTSHPIGAAELIYPARAQGDVTDAVQQIITFGRQKGIRQDLAIIVGPAAQQPFRWYLRDFKRLVVGDTAPEGISVVIGALQGAPESGRPDGFVVRTSQAGPYQPAGTRAYWRWLIYREATPGPAWNQAIVQFRE